MGAAPGSQTVRTPGLGPGRIAQTLHAKPQGRRLSVFLTGLLIEEFFIVCAAAYLASGVYHTTIFQEWPGASTYVTSALFVAMTVAIASLGPGRFMNMQRQTRYTFLWRGVSAVVLAFSFLLSGLFLLKIAQPSYSRATFIIQLVVVAFAVLTNRAVAYSRLQSAIANGFIEARRVILVGDPMACARFAVRLSGTGIRSVGSFRFPGEGSRGGEQLRHFVEECRRTRPDDILILASHLTLARTPLLATTLAELPAGLHVIPVESSDFLVTARVAELGALTTLQLSRLPLSTFDRTAKRTFDIAASCLGLLVLSPLLLLVSIAIKLDSKGPVLFRQFRHGYNNETIEVFKFRTMFVSCSSQPFVQTSACDQRVTRIGRMLRRTNIDELPQLINVLRGEMSIVGPRPHATMHNEMFEPRISAFSRRHIVKPGITGWAQVNGLRGETDTLEKMQRRVEYDLYYIDNWSLLFDLRIIIMTLLSKTAYLNAY